MHFDYRRSALKAYAPGERPVVLGAFFDLKLDYRANLEKRAGEFAARRKASQPPGASIGSMFKNPAGRLCRALDRGRAGSRAGGWAGP